VSASAERFQIGATAGALPLVAPHLPPSALHLPLARSSARVAD
jgi:hypothetical protein